MNEWFIIVNPNAGMGEGIKKWEEIKFYLDFLNIPYQYDFTNQQDDAFLITQRQIEAGLRNICIAGGDGTLNEVVNAVLKQRFVPSSDILISMIPLGTGNDWCRNFEISKDIEKSIHLLKDGKIIYQDAGKASFYSDNEPQERYFANIAGTGFDAFVAKKTNDDKKSNKTGTVLYLKNLLTSLISYKSVNCKIIYDNDSIETRMFSLSVGKGKFNGGGMKQLPFAIFNDGLLDFTLIKDMNIFEVLSNVGKLYNGSHINHPKVETHKTSQLIVESSEPLLLELDGESVGISPFKFEVIPNVLKILSSV